MISQRVGQKVASTAYEYVGAGKMYTKAEIANAKALLESAKFADTKPNVAEGIKSYVASHQGITVPVTPKAKGTYKGEHIDFFG